MTKEFENSIKVSLRTEKSCIAFILLVIHIIRKKKMPNHLYSQILYVKYNGLFPLKKNPIHIPRSQTFFPSLLP